MNAMGLWSSSRLAVPLAWAIALAFSCNSKELSPPEEVPLPPDRTDTHNRCEPVYAGEILDHYDCGDAPLVPTTQAVPANDSGTVDGGTAGASFADFQPVPASQCDQGGAPTDAPWTEVAKLVANDGAVGGQFGYSVAICGPTVIVGSSGGIPHAFKNTGAGWTADQELRAEILTGSGPAFIPGAAVSASGSVAVIRPYVFMHDGSSWIQHQRLMHADYVPGDWNSFSHAVAVSGDTILVGAQRDDERATDAGAVYVFVWSGDSWDEQQKLTASDGASGDEFGVSVSISDDTAVVGAWGGPRPSPDTGSAYVFARQGGRWTEQQKLTGGEAFGASVSISGDTIVAAEPNGPLGPYVFVLRDGAWVEQQRLTASDGASFGSPVSVSGDTALVGYSWGPAVGGSAYVFARSGGVWTQRAKLTASDGTIGDQFGWSVALAGDTAVVGAMRNDERGPEAGAAYVFSAVRQ